MWKFMRRVLLIGGLASMLFALTVNMAHAQGYFGEYSPGSPGAGGRSYGGGRGFLARPPYGFGGGATFGFQPAYRPYVWPSLVVPADNQSARINIAVKPDAEIWFDDVKTMQTGTQRAFLSPPLQGDGDYRYRIQVRWMDHGKRRATTRQIVVHAGDDVQLSIPDAVQANAR